MIAGPSVGSDEFKACIGSQLPRKRGALTDIEWCAIEIRAVVFPELDVRSSGRMVEQPACRNYLRAHGAVDIERGSYAWAHEEDDPRNHTTDTNKL